ncbi:nucleotidyltransferase domain-containing protein [Bailinhaonella thermotolerans]|uniref:DUF4037 domain-containing protein n=1 Tax=Bailinhaonella thermotolerans TaxID=1070861 RepID=A0A3A4AQI7_9ACTN|nr:DUF4037 domain-containing protein [Bailinhaonella thermotolerans]RJL31976.1 DUF4037 domain-containing protein [Bailinhaonella thermotolerans]
MAVPLAAERLLPSLLRILKGPHAAALGGSHAKRAADEHSDLDLYLFAEAVASPAEIRAALASIADADIAIGGAANHLWGTNIDFRAGGLLVETTVRTVPLIESTLAECERGEVVATPMPWCPGGFFYNHAALADLASCHPLHDPDGLLETWRSRAAAYPPALREAIVARHAPLATLWLDNPHYDSAIRRADVVYTQSIVLATIHNLLQLLYAINETPFPGDKRAIAHAAAFRRAPRDLPATLARLAFPAADPTPALLAEQRTHLRRLATETLALWRE